MTSVFDFELSPDCPVRLGKPLRVATSAWQNWGISWTSEVESEELLARSGEAYGQEWESSSEVGLLDIARAATEAGLSDCNRTLNQAVAQKVRRLTHGRSALTILDVGAGTGETTAAVVTACPWLAGPSRWHLLDPSGPSLKQALERLANHGLHRNEQLLLHQQSALGMGEIFKPESFDLIIANASLHHHADLGRVFRVLHALLESGGVLVVGDWHNSVWFYPGEVLRLLETFNWPDKGADLQRFRSVFITRTAPSRSSRLARANQQICEFWRAYARVRTKEAPRFSLLEGHRPADDYSLLLRAAGFSEVRCDILFEDSELLCVHCGARI